MFANKLTELTPAAMKQSKTANQNHYYVMRHGQSLANHKGIIVSHAINAISKYGLTTRGCEQVTEAALKTRLDSNTIIVSSDYKRAVETAEIMKSVLSCPSPVRLEQNLRERDFGKLELTDQQNYNNVWQQDLSDSSGSTDTVESVEKTLARALKVIYQLELDYQNQTILLVGHGDVLQILLAHNKHINPRLHRSLNNLANADIRSLNHLELIKRWLSA